MNDLPEVERTAEVPAQPEEVWLRIVEGELAQEWLGLRLEPRPGGKVTAPDRELIGTVEEVSPGRSITWSWREPDGEPSQVTIDLEPTDAGTEVTVTERLIEYRIDGRPPTFYARAA